MPFTQGPRVPDGATRKTRMLTGARNSGAEWKRNSLAPTENPKAAAIKAAPAWEAGVQKAISDKSYLAGVNAINLEEMAAAIEATPESAVADGMEKRAAKIQRVAQALSELQAQDCAVVDALPKATQADRKARMDRQYQLGLTLKSRLTAKLKS
jgi:hypothetical protein